MRVGPDGSSLHRTHSLPRACPSPLAAPTFVALAAVALAVAGCGGQRPVAVRGDGQATSLRVVVRPAPGATPRRATLTCDGSPAATGFIADSDTSAISDHCELISGTLLGE